MPKINVTAQDIDSVATKLDALGGSLSESQRALLLAVFGLARNTLSAQSGKPVAPAGHGPAAISTSGALPSLSEAFKRTFSPGTAPEVEGQSDPGSWTEGPITWTNYGY